MYQEKMLYMVSDIFHKCGNVSAMWQEAIYSL